jgi:2-polyprenyl-3-methyl-5-hydroxy-6-metoxy-1,4-benzoquinol methylase
MASIEEIKEYWNRRPCNIRHSNKELFTPDYFNEVEERKYFVEPHIPGFANFSQWKNKRVLEIGCGIGTDAVNFVRAGAIYTGIELSTTSLDITRTRLTVMGLEGRATLKNINAESLDDLLTLLPPDGEKFDLIYSFGVIHHSACPERILDNCSKLIKPGVGVCKIMLYATDSWKNFLIEEGISQPEAQNGCPMAKTYTQHEIREILSSIGFTNIDIMQTHIFPYKVDKYVQYIYEKEDWFKCMPPELFSILEKRLGWHLCITCYFPETPSQI